MQMRNTSNSYGFVAKAFHWTLFLLLTLMLSLSYFLDDVPDDYKGLAYNIHKLTGLTILTLMVLRICWAIINPKPALPKDTQLWQRVAERIVHFSLYLFVIVMPLAGWIGSCAANRCPHLGSFSFSLPVPQDKSLQETSFNVHEIVAIVLITLISVHALAALYHHFIKRDNVLKRMMS